MPIILVVLEAFFSLVLTVALPWKSSISFNDKNSIVNVIAQQGRRGQDAYRVSMDTPTDVTHNSSRREDRVLYSEAFKLRTGIFSLAIKMPGDFQKRPNGFRFDSSGPDTAR